MGVPRLGGELGLKTPAPTPAPATPDSSDVCDLHRSSQQHQILNPLREAGDGTHIFMDNSQTHFH